MSNNTAWIDVMDRIIQTLKNDQRLRNDTNGVFQYIPNNRTFPYIVVGEGVEIPFDSFDTDGRELTLNISVWSKEKGFERSYEILDRINAILDHADLSFNDFLNVLIESDNSNPVKEVIDDLNVIEVSYRIVVQNE